MKPIHRYRLAWFILGVSIVGWPITAFTVFKEEPQGILGLSWFAIIMTSFDIVCTTDVRKEQDK